MKLFYFGFELQNILNFSIKTIEKLQNYHKKSPIYL